MVAGVWPACRWQVASIVTMDNRLRKDFNGDRHQKSHQSACRADDNTVVRPTASIRNYRIEVFPYSGFSRIGDRLAKPYRRKATNGKNGRKGVQIDLLIQTRLWRQTDISTPSCRSGNCSVLRPGRFDFAASCQIARRSCK